MSLASAMRFDDRGKPRRSGHDYAVPMAALQLVRHLLMSGFVVMPDAGRFRLEVGMRIPQLGAPDITGVPPNQT